MMDSLSVGPAPIAPKCKPDEVVLKSCDDIQFVVKRKDIMQHSGLFNKVLTECRSQEFYPLQNVNGQVLGEVLEYVKKHCEIDKKEGEERLDTSKRSEDDPKLLDLEYLKQLEDNRKRLDLDYLKVHITMLYQIMEAANYLEMERLLDLTCSAAADMFKGKMPDEIRKTFNIVCDLNPEEQKEVNYLIFE